MEYKIVPHRVACILTISGNGAEYECMLMSEQRDPECRPAQSSVNAYSTVHFYALPEPVRQSIKAHFAKVFSIPNDGRRGKFVDSLQAFTIEG